MDRFEFPLDSERTVPVQICNVCDEWKFLCVCDVNIEEDADDG